jgi:molybdate transport system substrate-binding protein
VWLHHSRFAWFFLLLVSVTGPAHAETQVPDVVVLCEPTLQRVVADIGASWRRQTGVPVRIITSPTWAILEQISHSISGDLVIGEGDDAAASAIQRKLIQPETLRHLWRNVLVVVEVAPTGSDSGTPQLASLAGKAPVALVDPTVALAGADSMKALQALGLWEAVSAKSVGVVDTADASYLLATGKVRLALLYATDVAANRSFVVTDRLAPDSYPPINYWVAKTHEASSPNSERFQEFLREASSQQQAQRDGLEVIP